MAEKVRALLVRGKARDVFDIWLLITQGVSVNRKLVEKKLPLYGNPFTPQDLNDALDKAKRIGLETCVHSCRNQYPGKMLPPVLSLPFKG